MSGFGTVYDGGFVSPISPPPKPTQGIGAWSYSRFQTWKRCPRQAMYLYVEKRKEPKSAQQARGTLMHEAMAAIATGKMPITDGLTPESITAVHTMAGYHGIGKVFVDTYAEQQLAFTQEWKPTGWFDRDVYCRVVFDYVEREEHAGHDSVKVVEYKSGKRYPDHVDQAELYALAALVQYGTVVARVSTSYFDLPPPNNDFVVTFTNTSVPALREKWDALVRPMLADREYPTRAGPHCRWCTFAKSKGGPCEQG